MSALIRAFSSRKGKMAKTSRSSHGGHQSKISDASQITLHDKELNPDVAKGLERELYKVPMPEQTEGMSDLIKSHVEGDHFPYFAVMGQEEESKPSRLGRLRSFMPFYNKDTLPTLKLPPLELTEMSCSLELEELLLARRQPGKKSQQLNFKPYVRIKMITFLYTPVMSSTARYTNFVVSIVDDRFPDGLKVAQSAVCVTNQEHPIELSCDYCIPRKAISKLHVSIDLESRIINAGEQWGSMYIEVNLEESDYPYMAVKRDALAMVRAPFTTLEQRKVDPDRIDVGFTGTEIEWFRQMYQNGDIADSGEPSKERVKKSSYSKSTVRGTQKQKPLLENVPEGWDQLEGAGKPLVPAYEASISVPSNDNDEEQDLDKNEKLQAKAAWAEEQERLRYLANKATAGEPLGEEPATIDPNELAKSALKDTLEKMSGKHTKGEVKVGWKT